jgi:hypothetical protein
VIIHFQKSRWAQPDETTFYVNVAASSKRWLGFEGKQADRVPPHYACDWHWRAILLEERAQLLEQSSEQHLCFC